MRHSIIILMAILLLAGCGKSSNYSNDDDRSEYIGNPHSEGTGHHAGYEWAKRTGGACKGNSQSFNNGCEEYYIQTGE